jgi:hypothetical protein
MQICLTEHQNIFYQNVLNPYFSHWIPESREKRVASWFPVPFFDLTKKAMVDLGNAAAVAGASGGLCGDSWRLRGSFGALIRAGRSRLSAF